MGISTKANKVLEKILFGKQLGGIVTISSGRNQIEEGKVFSVDKLWTGVVDNASRNILIRSKNTKKVHFSSKVSAGGNCYVYLYENVTASAPTLGSPAVTVNHNRDSSINMTASVYFNVLPTYLGTPIEQNLVEGGSGPHSSGGDSNLGGDIFILKKYTDYVLSVVNKSGGAIPIAIDTTFYRED